MSQPYLSFNDSIGMRFKIPGYPDEEAEEVAAALREPMPLKEKWALWEQVATGGYATKKVVTFGTAQEFWGVWNGIPQPSELLEGKKLVREQSSGQPLSIDAIMVFREGISPEWEDHANANGGHFQIQLKPSTTGGQIDEYWNNLVLGVVGETFESSNMITGVRLVDKLSGKGKVTDAIRVELWYHSKATTVDVNNIKKSMDKILTTRLDGTPGPVLKSDSIQDKKHGSIGK
jgi:translation initiation factor 4E